jgi:hypothetical protein
MADTPKQVCADCGLNTDFVGIRHRCQPHLVAALKAQRQAQAASTDVANSPTSERSMANDMANKSARAPGLNRASPTYRYRNPTKRRLYMRDLMRKVRASERASPT